MIVGEVIVPANVMNAVDTDDEETYILSGKLYQKDLGSKVLLFNPDGAGGPILLRGDAKTLLEKCSQGISKKEVLVAMPFSMSVQDRKTFFVFLKKNCIIQRTADASLSTTPSEGRKKGVSIWFHITNDCNLRCPYCFVKKSKDALDKAKIDSFVSSMLESAGKRNYTNITLKFAGGEPLLRPDLIQYAIDAIEQKKDKRFHVRYAVLSNGTQINPENVSFLKKNRMAISISLDGYGDVHDQTRKDTDGNGSFGIIERNIRLLKKNGIRPFILSTISEKTIDFLPQLTQWLLDNELHSRYNFVRYFDYSLREYDRFCEKIVMAMRKSSDEIKNHPFGPFFALNWSLADLSFIFPIQRQPCGIGKSHLVVNHEGGLALCPMTLDKPFGTIEKDILEQYEKQESKYEQLKPEDKCCQKCQWHRVCGTGCPILNESLSGHPNKRSPFCSAYRQLIPAYIDIYGWALQQLSMSDRKCDAL